MDSLKDVLKKDELEELLVANWTQFIDSSRLMAFVLQNTRDRIEHFAILPSSSVINKGVRLTISRFQMEKTGFVVWVEFSVPIGTNSIAVGTTELVVEYGGEVRHVMTLGNLHHI